MVCFDFQYNDVLLLDDDQLALTTPKRKHLGGDDLFSISFALISW
jgi:hypothetical protein